MHRSRKLAVLAETVVARTLLVLGIVVCSLPLAAWTGCRSAVLTADDQEIVLPESVATDSSTAAADTEPVYYIILETRSVRGDKVVRVPLKDNETVLDAISSIGGLSQLFRFQIWIHRIPFDENGVDQNLPVDWDAITRGKSTAANYRLMPNDRIFIVERPSLRERFQGVVRKPVDWLDRLRGPRNSGSFSTDLRALRNRADRRLDATAEVQ